MQGATITGSRGRYHLTGRVGEPSGFLTTDSSWIALGSTDRGIGRSAGNGGGRGRGERREVGLRSMRKSNRTGQATSKTHL